MNSILKFLNLKQLRSTEIEKPVWVSQWVVKKSNLGHVIPKSLFLIISAAAAAAKSLQSCLTLCGPIDGSPPGSPVPGILQARTLEWVAMAFSSAWKWKGKGKSLSRVRLFLTPWTAAFQAPPPMGFSRQEDWSGVPLPSLDNIWISTKPQAHCLTFQLFHLDLFSLWQQLEIYTW